ncbi:hypothetical protein DTO164E3_5653 [Paecilomyces variotii]|nr:hypothetical protein DTO032I3_7436 [Paecilomyces variotii]KAJ9197511.1 hypothetical protein DTO164E3_5653 [Paecilomyces variotii]KAJ9265426.1 hypothetical protein DTO195F2_1772 [Paecilomyces variotii]KAJ9278055.1 hypothetical protein DTO021D3_5022 [Paecilomyces variotii]KAJ9378724.1 hypothetical protein DTO063F5_7527 [Paecilomyces variotii]
MRGFVSYTGVDLTLIKDYRIASVSGTLLVRKRLQENDNACVQRDLTDPGQSMWFFCAKDELSELKNPSSSPLHQAIILDLLEREKEKN